MIHFVVADDYFSELYGEDGDEQRGIHSPSLLLSALGVPRQSFNGHDLYPDIFSKAASLMRSLALNHAFYNANKRTAMMATIVFLEQNGYKVIAPKGKMMRLAVKIVLHKPSINNIARTLKKYSQELEREPMSRVRAFWERILAGKERYSDDK